MAVFITGGQAAERVNYVGYIQSSGTQFIDTLFKPNNNTRVVMDVRLTSFPTGNEAVFGSYDGTNNFWAYYRYDSSQYRATCGGTTQKRISYTEPTVRTKIELSNAGFLVGESSVSVDQTEFQIDYTVYLFALNRNGAVYYPASCEIYSCQIYDNNVLVRDLWPCFDTEGEACFYDKVEGKYYYNKGTGEFVAGGVPEKLVNYVSYIKANGNQYVDPGVKISASKAITLKIVCDCRFVDPNGDNGVGTVVSGNIFWFGCYQSYLYYGNGTNDVRLDAYQKYDGARRVFELDAVQKTFSVNGLVSLTGLSFTTPYITTNFLLPARTNGMEIYSCRVYDSGVLIRDLWPCYDPGGVACLYDKVEKKYYYNQGTGEFIAGGAA